MVGRLPTCEFKNESRVGRVSDVVEAAARSGPGRGLLPEVPKGRPVVTKKDSGAWGILANAATMGIHLVSCTFVGLAIGYFLEDWLCDLGWCYKPWIMLFWLVAGIAAGFKNMYEEARKLQKAEKGRPDVDGN